MVGYSLDEGGTRRDWERLAIGGVCRGEERATVDEFCCFTLSGRLADLEDMEMTMVGGGRAAFFA